MFRAFDFVFSENEVAPAVEFLEGDSDDLEKVHAGVFSLTASIPYFFGVISNLLLFSEVIIAPFLNSVDVK